ncbi:general substrate transporter [Mycolicibacterium fortuitum subsp. fortuitum DSM 46621 = ATCC 6841 = JCM 6387]|uniref:Putative proline/betaine transporter n=1 Tax=Mycolicibacterium fortuitum subsp. fortuitum DSM 46621 = ATCC 6841 = JCM 6387 TaxID=1214102 RepID=K0V9S0_MYCFO|nr:Permeases of the major facilitator superfamily [Mycobacterium sp. VKM Ac-1817D]EJZ14375.1 general substrate transporter [Mycolicibacterium fortuitum subsp. fortuitum DSM 46621 = ATCC 6841 = JCM 6387]BDD97411.1 MFS transporter [Mycolicibacterium fortuitum subsp. fortuitum]CRL56927.1 sugar phosphate permease [Mycolicibacterium fortuitum subsp. fortuitum DSM 46621 = ATCC 6841 = JCM 6387]CRL75582.1 sugar phosphate permease [Mycolicibacter nonchromogenicus]
MGTAHSDSTDSSDSTDGSGETSDSPETAEPATVEETPPEVQRRAVAASAIGNATEWFDYGIYAYGVTYISAAIFPGNAQDATLLALMTFAVSFLVRPLGGFVWGPLGDRIGRKHVLAITILLMAGSTLCVGLVPTYASIGIWAPLLMVLLRMIQGFSTGGEYGGAATFMAEYAPSRRRGFLGSFLEFGTLAGFSLGALMMLGFSAVLTDQQMGSWGWRLPFLVAAPLGLIGVYLRTRLSETPVFRELSEAGEEEPQPTTELKDLLLQYWGPVLRLGGLVVALNVVNYTLLTYMPTYLKSTIGLSTDESLVVPIIGMLAMMVFVPFAGHISDRVGRKPMWWFSLIGLFVAGVPMFLLMGTNVTGAVIGFAVLGLLYVPQLATISATFPAMFPTQVRYAGFAIAYNVSTSIFGGTAPAVNDWLVNLTGENLVPAYYMMGACVIGAVALAKVPETARCPISGTEIPGTPEAPPPVEYDQEDEPSPGKAA